MKESELLEEGWVKFRRFYCVEGHIDIWFGDSAHNPNTLEQPRLNLNSFAAYVRLNGEGLWYYNGYRRGLQGFTAEMSEVATSKEIWDELSKYNYED